MGNWIDRRLRPFRYTGEHRPCALCGASESEVVGRRDRDLAPLTSVICRGCGLVRTDPMPTEAELDDFYRHHYRRYYKGSDNPTRSMIERGERRARRRLGYLEPFLTPGGRILDFGAGAGEFVAAAREAGYEADGFEPNEAFARFASGRYDAPIEVARWESVERPAGHYDFISVHHVLEHLRDPVGALQRCHEWLKPDGRLHVGVPNIDDPTQLPISRFHFAHVHNFNPKSLEMAGRKAGFETVWSTDLPVIDMVFRRLPEPPRNWFNHPENAAELAATLHGTRVLGVIASRDTLARRFSSLRARGSEILRRIRS